MLVDESVYSPTPVCVNPPVAPSTPLPSPPLSVITTVTGSPSLSLIVTDPKGEIVALSLTVCPEVVPPIVGARFSVIDVARAVMGSLNADVDDGDDVSNVCRDSGPTVLENDPA